MTEERRLAAIMFTDMVGYTALMGRDEDRARYLVKRSRAHLKSFVEHYHGQWLEEVGDSTLSVFPSAVEAVDCALAIQHSLRREVELSHRIGIHLGDVVFAERRIYGDGVNVASRIEGLASPGGVAVSEPVRSAIRGQRGVRARSLGRKWLKNVDEPVRVYALTDARGAAIQGVLRGLWARRVPQVLAAYALIGVGLVLLVRWLAARYGLPAQWIDAVAAALVVLTPAVVMMSLSRAGSGSDGREGDDEHRWRPGRLPFSLNLAAMVVVVAILVHDAPMPGEPVASIAVLPFANLSDDEANQYFSDGLTDELISTLARIDALNVAARTSSFMFKDSRKDIQDIAQELGVRHVLDGSVRKAGNQVRISVELVDARKGYSIWQESYEKTLDDIFAVQEDIARSVVSQLDVILPTKQNIRLSEAPTDSIEAYNFYLQGLEYLHRPVSEQNLALAESLFRNALMLDSDYAQPHSGLCRAALKRYEMTNAPRYIDQGEASCQAAMRLDNSLHEVRVALGNLYLHTGRLDEAESQFEKVVAEAPRLADAWVGLGRTLEKQGEGRLDEAENALRRAVSLQPADWSTHMALGEFLYWQLRYGEALKAYRRVTELMPGNHSAHSSIGAIHIVRGEMEKGIEALERSLKLSPSRQSYRNLGLAYFYLGNYDASMEAYRGALDAAEEDHWTWGDYGDVLRHAGHPERAREAYEKAAALARAVLERNAVAWKVQARLATYLYHLDEKEEAGRLLREALREAPDHPEALYYAAQFDMLSGRGGEAVTKLKAAISAGFPKAVIIPHPDFRSLNLKEEFKLSGDSPAEGGKDDARKN